MREQVRCAKRVAGEAGVRPPHEHPWRMSTGGGACAPGLEELFGAIVPGLWADPGRDVQTRPRCARGRGWLMPSIREGPVFS